MISSTHTAYLPSFRDSAARPEEVYPHPGTEIDHPSAPHSRQTDRHYCAALCAAPWALPAAACLHSRHTHTHTHTHTTAASLVLRALVFCLVLPSGTRTHTPHPHTCPLSGQPTFSHLSPPIIIILNPLARRRPANYYSAHYYTTTTTTTYHYHYSYRTGLLLLLLLLHSVQVFFRSPGRTADRPTARRRRPSFQGPSFIPLSLHHPRKQTPAAAASILTPPAEGRIALHHCTDYYWLRFCADRLGSIHIQLQ